jgi:hypothetical protein
MKLLSAFGGGLFLIPLGLLLGALYSFYRGYKQSKSGSLEDSGGGGTRESDINIPFWRCPATIYGYAFLIAAVASALMMWSDR